MKETLNYYEQNAGQFIRSTRDADFSETQNRFLDCLKPGGKILDLGCGSGRDTKYFLQKGYPVEAIDGSAELCRAASEYTGIPVRQMLFGDFMGREEYDGIWACASILHLPYQELQKTIEVLAQALKPDGILYTSFKYGTYEGIRNTRYFTDMTREKFQAMIDGIETLTIKEMWITSDIRKGRETEKWLNIILTKTSQNQK